MIDYKKGKINHDDESSLPAGLYVVATPIGNLGDITFRAVEILKAANLVVAEDTRVSAKLFSRFGIKKRMVSLHDHSHASAVEKIGKMLLAGSSIALITDAGTPLVSDPGFELVRWARENGVPIFAIPGASSVIAALSVSGLAPDRFTFAGFSPTKQGKRREFFQSLKNHQATIIMFESPARITESLHDMLETFGDRRIFLGRELTKLHEEGIYGHISEAITKLEMRASIKGEFTVVLEGSDQHEAKPEDVETLLRKRLQEVSTRDAVKEVAEVCSVPRGEVYQLALRIQDEK